jgi:release factor glutamine methyltransferase
MAWMLSWGRIRQAVQPLVLKYWLNGRLKNFLTTRVEGLELSVFPTVFHPRYFGSSAILARFVSSLNLEGTLFLDVGCGSGIVAICAARAGARVTAVDINPEAVRCTLVNAERYALKIDARTGDLFSSLGDARFEIIAWNPPFLPGTPATLAEAALYGGPRFDVIQRFVDAVGNHMNRNASVYTILSADIGIASIEEMFRTRGFIVSRVQSKRWGLGETMVILRAMKAG